MAARQFRRTLRVACICTVSLALAACTAPSPGERPTAHEAKPEPESRGIVGLEARSESSPPSTEPADDNRIAQILDAAAPGMLPRVERHAEGAAFGHEIQVCRYSGRYDIESVANPDRLLATMGFVCDGWNEVVEQPFAVTVGMPVYLVPREGSWELDDPGARH